MPAEHGTEPYRVVNISCEALRREQPTPTNMWTVPPLTQDIICIRRVVASMAASTAWLQYSMATVQHGYSTAWLQYSMATVQHGYSTANMPKGLQTVTAASTQNKAEVPWAGRDKPSTIRDHIKDTLLRDNIWVS